MLASTARFTNKKVHTFKEVRNDHAISYCGLSERVGIWCEADYNKVTCKQCIRLFGLEHGKGDLHE
jgi:hypothetical protein